VQNLSYENEFGLHEKEPEGEHIFIVNCFPRSLVLTQRQKATRKWPIPFMPNNVIANQHFGEKALYGLVGVTKHDRCSHREDVTVFPYIGSLLFVC